MRSKAPQSSSVQFAAPQPVGKFSTSLGGGRKLGSMKSARALTNALVGRNTMNLGTYPTAGSESRDLTRRSA